MPMAVAAFRESMARNPGESSPEATMTRMVLPFSMLVTSTTVFRGKELVAT
jgi:hypothetical protein